ncbi:MAG: EAL domain-containing protein [Ectothiorhodospiraceae bacterium]|nr:EAL domain-containing protein [Ectothiorhodospiraceae bacterium]
MLVVDDNLGDYLLFEHYLEAEAPGHYELAHVSSYAELEQRLRAGALCPDVLLIDCDSGSAAGLGYLGDAVQRLPTASVVGLAERLDGVVARQCLQAGAVDLIAKDETTPAHFAHVLAYAAANHRRIQALFDRAHFDTLTGLANRNLLNDRIDHALERSKRSGEYVALLMIDLDDFKQVNDGLGHDIGDGYLRAVAGAIRASVRESDTVARIGGDEFAVLLEGLRQAESAMQIATKILGLTANRMEVDGKRIQPSMSIGISLFASTNTRFSAQWLLKAADTALYRAKGRGKNCYHVFTEELDQELVHNIGLDRQLREALARDQLRVHYQPIVAGDRRGVVAVEALLRWAHPKQGLLEPRAFLPALEKLGLMPEVGEFVVHEAVERLASLRAQGLRELSMHVNVSAAQLATPGFAAFVVGVLAEHGVPASHLCIELTEAVLFERAASAERELRALRKEGVKVAIDDFGTGFGSYSYLKELAVDEVKIDGSYVRGLGEGRANRAIVRSILTLARELDVGVTAEGVENLEQYRQLGELGRADLQGFLFYPALPGDEIAPVVGAYVPGAPPIPRRPAPGL